MDKQTLSNYGWLVIVTLILAIMLAFATPFGTYVGDGVVSIANGFVGASDQAIDEDTIATNQSKWEEKLNNGLNNNSSTPNYSNIIPEGGIYITGLKSQNDCTSDCNNGEYSGWCICNVAMYNEGDEFPSTVNDYDLYIYNNVEYMYNAGYDCGGCPYYVKIDGETYGERFHTPCNGDVIVDGWTVKQTNSTILSTINGKPVTKMSYFTYSIPANIPETIVDLKYAFSYNSDITTLPTIPASVKRMDFALQGCTRLTGTLTIDANPTSYIHCFDGLSFFVQKLKLTGNSSMINTLGNINTSYCNHCHGYCTCGNITG